MGSYYIEDCVPKSVDSDDDSDRGEDVNVSTRSGCITSVSSYRMLSAPFLD